MDRTKVLKLFRETLRASREFRDYNFRSYFWRRNVDDFRKAATLKDETEIKAFLEKKSENLEMLKRQTIIQNLYHTAPSVMEQ
mmetsp:Transcript_59892/g.68097  ORF Transcript_59892/g.68097 Transcript_59892/m.68097 type:complete len:83 (+) Transcript_59892:57-305(+)